MNNRYSLIIAIEYEKEMTIDNSNDIFSFLHNKKGLI